MGSGRGEAFQLGPAGRAQAGDRQPRVPPATGPPRPGGRSGRHGPRPGGSSPTHSGRPARCRWRSFQASAGDGGVGAGVAVEGRQQRQGADQAAAEVAHPLGQRREVVEVGRPLGARPAQPVQRSEHPPPPNRCRGEAGGNEEVPGASCGRRRPHGPGGRRRAGPHRAGPAEPRGRRPRRRPGRFRRGDRRSAPAAGSRLPRARRRPRRRRRPTPTAAAARPRARRPPSTPWWARPGRTSGPGGGRGPSRLRPPRHRPPAPAWRAGPATWPPMPRGFGRRDRRSSRRCPPGRPARRGLQVRRRSPSVGPGRQDVEQARQGDPTPVGPVGQLVATARRRPSRGGRRRGAAGAMPGRRARTAARRPRAGSPGGTGLRDPAVPGAGPGLGPLGRLGAPGEQAPFLLATQRRRAVAYWNDRIIPATSRRGERCSRRSVDRLERLTLEVDDHQVPSGVEHLAEVVVAVDADASAAERSRRRGSRRGRAARGSRSRSWAPASAASSGRSPSRLRNRPSVRPHAAPRIAWYSDRWSSADRSSVPKARSSVAPAARAWCSSAVRRPSRSAQFEVGADGLGRRLRDGRLEMVEEVAPGPRRPRPVARRRSLR